MMFRDRPDFPPGYGISTGEEGMLDWERVDTALSQVSTFWVATVRQDLSPHITPIWGAWTDTHLYIEGSDQAVWARNLSRAGSVAAGVESDGLQISIRGTASYSVPDEETYGAIATNYESKYPYRPDRHGFWEITPETILAFDVTSLDAFAKTPTRFRPQTTKPADDPRNQV